MMWISIGQRNAAVLPLPVCAIPMTSRPLSSVGIPIAWMGVGWENSLLRIAFMRGSSNPKWAKLVTGRGAEGPDTYQQTNCEKTVPGTSWRQNPFIHPLSIRWTSAEYHPPSGVCMRFVIRCASKQNRKLIFFIPRSKQLNATNLPNTAI